MGAVSTGLGGASAHVGAFSTDVGALKTIDEATAWALLRRIRAAGDEPAREATGAAELPVVIRPDGSWRASAEVDEGARLLLDLFAPLLAARDIVVGQLGQSLDGRIATEGGASHYVSGPADLERLHRLRALVDAVVVGADTVVSDDPRLSVRKVPGGDPVRVVIDPRGRVPPDRRVFRDEGAETLWIRGARPDDDALDRAASAEAVGVERGASVASAGATAPAAVRATVVRIPYLTPGSLDLSALLAALRARGLRRVLVEGGGLTVSRFLEAGLLDRLHLTVAPLLIGSGRPSITLPTIDALEEALRPAYRHFRLGGDHVFDLDLRAPRPRDG